ncbi:MAG: hypothetical protein LBG96_01425 [Tannerella sp.]|nr:hypothetical protein [Tannerella sp.]
MKYSVLLLSVCLLTACSGASRLERALILAGDNRAELEHVLAHYRDDPQKLAAARFLIENMPGKYADDNKPFEAYQPMLKEWLGLKQMEQRGYLYIEKEKSDSLIRAYRLNKPQKKLYDVNHITASYLINNIERAFEVWTAQPWGKEISFDVFCEDILPYRLGSEPLENWRDIVLEQYKLLYDSLCCSNTDAVTACIRACNVMGNTWDLANAMPSIFPDMSYSMIHTVRSGHCEMQVKYGIYTMRALGIPVAWDYTPQWPFRSLGHNWCTVRNEEGEYLPFIPTESKPGEPHKPDHTMAKAYRHIFERNRESLIYIAESGDIPMSFRNPWLKDVSSLTFPSADIAIAPEWLHEKQDYYYLAVFNNRDWVPVHWAKAGNPVVFTDMGKNIAYLPVCFRQNRLYSCGMPFLFREEKIQWLKADTVHKQTVKLTRKHPDLMNWGKRMTNGRFEAANRPDFSDASVLYTIGQQTASGAVLYYENVPTNALFLLRNLTKGEEERIFTYENGKQVWW